MVDRLRVVGTSRATAEVNDRVISNPDENATALTRRIARPIIVVNANDETASVQCCLMHQQRASKESPWQDADSFSLAKLRAGQEIRLTLTAGETKRLYETLSQLYQVEVGGWDRGEVRNYQVINEGQALVLSGRGGQIVAELLDQEGESLWDSIEELRPWLAPIR